MNTLGEHLAVGSVTSDHDAGDAPVAGRASDGTQSSPSLVTALQPKLITFPLAVGFEPASTTWLSVNRLRFVTTRTQMA